MSHQRKIQNLASACILLVSLMLFFPMGSCEQIDFEPGDILYVTTDSIQTTDELNYVLNGSVLNIGQEDIIQHGFVWSYLGLDSIIESTIELGSKESVGKFSSVLSGLKLKSSYYIRAYATTNTGTQFGKDAYFRTPDPVIPSTISDIDGNNYKVVVIGNQAWMAENLKASHYSDGTAIALVENDSSWEAMTVDDKAYCWYDNDPSNKNYGAYYTWAATMNGREGSNLNPSRVQGVCPDGWHVPSDAEFNQMHIHLGMNPRDADRVGFLGTWEAVGDKMKGKGIPAWSENLSAWWINESGFSALPCGLRTHTGIFDNLYSYANFWTTTEYEDFEVWYRFLESGHSAVSRVHTPKKMGFSVRCLMD